MSNQEKKTIEKHYLKGSLMINGLFAMQFELNNILKGLTPVKHFDYVDGCLDLVI